MPLPLHTFREYQNKSFEWGVSDCCLFASDCCIESVGVDPAELFRGKYHSEIGAVKMLAKLGHIEEQFDKCFERVDVKQANRGDVVMKDRTVGIQWLGGVLCMSPSGIVLDKNFNPTIAWKVK